MSDLKSINPLDQSVFKTFPRHTPEQVRTAIARADHAFRTYRLTSFAERAQVLVRTAEILEAEKDQWGAILTREMGKPRQAGIDEVAKSARCCRYYAENAAKFLADEPAPSQNGDIRRIAYQPLGPILAVMPWNFPFWQVFRFAAPALMAGNTAILKHASNVPESALAIQEIFKRAGLAEGAFQTLLIGSDQVPAIIEDPRIRAVTLTGSDHAGSEVAALAGKHLKRVVLELGGSDPFIVMPSVDLDAVVKVAVQARTVNNGESCVAAKRFIVHQKAYDAFVDKFSKGMSSLKVGDPMDFATQIGPLATPQIRDDLAKQVERSVQAGARIVTGGKKLDGPGNFYAPTVLTDIRPDSPTYREEFFGPVGLVFRARDLDHAIEIANDNPFGLGSSFWSSDTSEQERFVRDIESGMAYVNQQVVSDPTVPFGGVKRSGYGRELSHFGIREFTNVKTIAIARASKSHVGSGVE